MKQINVGYDFGDLNVSVGTATEDAHVVNKAQVEQLNSALEGDLQAYADQAEADAKTYTDAKILGLGERIGTVDPNTGLPTTGSGDGGSIDKNDYWTFSEDGTILGDEVHKWEKLIAIVSNPDTSNNTVTNTDWIIEHAPHIADARHELNSVVIPAVVDEVLGEYKYAITTPLESGDVAIIGGVTITAGDNLDITTHTNSTAQATAIVSILQADNAFNTHYAILDNLAGELTFTEKLGTATGVDLSHNETGVVGGNISFSIEVNSVEIVDGGYTINHNLGYKYVNVSIYNDATDDMTDFRVHLIDANNLEVFNESYNPITVSGVINI